MVKFSIVATDYEGVVSPEVLDRFVKSFINQTFKDFEVIILHDGPRINPLPAEYLLLDNFTFIDTIFRANTWGHNLRTQGIKLSNGEYIINTNTDNFYYPNALEELSKVCNGNNIIIAPVLMIGLNYDKGKIWYDNPRRKDVSYLLKGRPPVYGNIDMMGLIATKDMWVSINYWYSLIEQSDGILYSELTNKYNYKYVDFIIGEHY